MCACVCACVCICNICITIFLPGRIQINKFIHITLGTYFSISFEELNRKPQESFFRQQEIPYSSPINGHEKAISTVQYTWSMPFFPCPGTSKYLFDHATDV